MAEQEPVNKIHRTDPAFAAACEAGAQGGINVRTYIASQAMQGILAGGFLSVMLNPKADALMTAQMQQGIALIAANMADRLIEALNA